MTTRVLTLSLVDDPMVIVAFKQNRDKFLALLQGKLFDVVTGKVEVNIHNGQIQSINVLERTYTHEG